jgi:FixJ family two-component response regulator
VEPATVFIVDDEAPVRTSLARLLAASGFLVEAFDSGEAFAARGAFDGTGCVILDLQMPGVSGIELQQRLAGAHGDLPVIFLSGRGDVPDSVKAMKQGAVDFLTKPVDEAVLLAAIDTALARQAAARAARDERDALRRRLDTLTAREREVLRHVITGALNKQIAGFIGIAEGTVKVHRGRVMEKLGARSVADLVRLCDAAGEPPATGQRVSNPAAVNSVL